MLLYSSLCHLNFPKCVHFFWVYTYRWSCWGSYQALINAVKTLSKVIYLFTFSLTLSKSSSCFKSSVQSCSVTSFIVFGLRTHGLWPTQTPLLFMGFSLKFWSGLPCAPQDLPHPGIECLSPALLADSLWLSHQENPYILGSTW